MKQSSSYKIVSKYIIKSFKGLAQEVFTQN
jgi:hypothetical protein